MSPPSAATKQPRSRPAVSLEDLVEEVTNKLQAGELVDVEAFAAQHPEFASQLRDLFPALQVLANLSVSASRSSASLDSALPADVGSGVLGDFRILREVGRGGMGIVYEAEQLSLRRRVALKVLPFAATLDPRHLQRFQNEARAAACLHHEHIVPVYAVGCDRGVHHFAMQFIDGHTLAQFLKKQGQGLLAAQLTAPHVSPSPEAGSPAAETAEVAATSTPPPSDAAYFRRVVQWGIDAALALEYAHGLGIVHRDIKPGNLMIDAQGKLWVTDFGLAMMPAEAGLTMTGDVVGTLRYMSPEQALAKHGLVDHRSDVYALGVTLYELLTGVPAVEGVDRREILEKIAHEEPRPPRARNRALPVDLETVVLKALAKEPRTRYATARELADDLRRVLEDRPIQARRPALTARLRLWGRRHPSAVWSALVGVVVGVAVVAGSVGWVANDRATRGQETKKGVAAAGEESLSKQRQGRLPEALSAALRAAGLAAGGVVDEALRRKADARVADLRLLEKLENVSLEYASASKDEPDGTSYFDGELADRLYRDAFQKADLDVEDLPAAEAGARIRGTTVAAELAAVLDLWAYVRLNMHGPADPDWKHLLQVARAADPDTWRGQLREALERDRALLLEMAASEEVFRLLPPSLHFLADVLRSEGAAARGLELMREAQRRHPDDFWSNAYLATLLAEQQPPELDEAIRYYTAALAIRPQSAGTHLNLGGVLKRKGRRDEAMAEFRAAIQCNGDYAAAHNNLGLSLSDKGQLDEAIAELRESLRLNKDSPDAHNNLGVALHDKGQMDEAIAEFREAIRLKKDYAFAHINLGQTLCDKNQLDEAIDECREALRLQKESALAHNNLGNALHGKGKLDEAITEYREAIRLQKDFALAHNNLGLSLHDKGQLDEAIAELRESLRLNKDYPEAHGNLGAALSDKGLLDEAIDEYRKAIRFKKDYWEAHANLGIDLHTKGQLEEAIAEYHEALRLQPNHPRVRNKLGAALRLKGALDKLPSILKGEAKPTDAADCLALAELCQKPYQRLYAASARFYGEAFAADPSLTDGRSLGTRYNAACAAALAGSGTGEDAATLTDSERARLRKQALDWLRGELAVRASVLEKGMGWPEKARARLPGQLRHWQQDTDLASVRGPEALSRLPDADRHAWQKLWEEVEALRRKAAGME